MAKVLMKGNEAVGKAAIEAGCRYFFDRYFTFCHSKYTSINI